MRIILTLAVVVCGAFVACADEPKQRAAKLQLQPTDKPTSYWMEQKMNYSQAILRGLATGDLRNVAMNADQMRMLSKIEGFLRRKEPGYQDQLKAFDFAGKEIARHARAGNLEGAAMSFQKMTISCFSCHAILRRSDLVTEQPRKLKLGK